MENKTQELLRLFKTEMRLGSGAEVSRALGVTRATVSNWAMGKTHMQPHIVWKVCEAIGVNPADAMCAVEQERALGLLDAQAWGRVRRMYIMSNIGAHMRRKRLLTYTHTHS